MSVVYDEGVECKTGCTMPPPPPPAPLPPPLNFKNQTYGQMPYKIHASSSEQKTKYKNII